MAEIMASHVFTIDIKKTRKSVAIGEKKGKSFFPQLSRATLLHCAGASLWFNQYRFGGKSCFDAGIRLTACHDSASFVPAVQSWVFGDTKDLS
ncbi:MAG: hypothetical protein ONB44_00230 [candidate division KSB1 bacterium]|nr:hypothetical protein [candidate division KSB1 bacterium]MDZ7300549.1 hypothetical protein [candidate division KSB1 bacterium]MDZ7309688.1 hypothetical protein [candidate division KSB1 bacterium]